MMVVKVDRTSLCYNRIASSSNHVRQWGLFPACIVKKVCHLLLLYFGFKLAKANFHLLDIRVIVTKRQIKLLILYQLNNVGCLQGRTKKKRYRVTLTELYRISKHTLKI